MLILTKSVLAMMISFIISIMLGIIIIPLLKRINASQRLSIYLEKTHSSKKNTPTMGGLIFILTSLFIYLIFYLLGKVSMNYSILIVLITFTGYGLIGFVDDFLIIKRNNNKGLSEYSKIVFQLVIAVIFFYLFSLAGNEPLIWIHTLGIKYNIGGFYGIFILLVLLASSNAVNLTDGLDGLAAGLCTICFITFGILSYNTGWLEGFEDLAIFSFIMVGSLLGFLVFNISPAKVFMGDTGSLALGATLGTYAILTRHEILLIIIGIVFVIETVSVILQRYYYKLTHKRLFPMAPLHHSFEKIGWNERDIVKLFWIVGLIGSMVAIIFGVWY